MCRLCSFLYIYTSLLVYTLLFQLLHEELKHYEHLGIDPKTKTLLFSDSLDFERATKIYNEFKDKTNVAFGIGTYLSNDTFAEPLNIVTKVTKCNGFDVAKLSDCEGKNMCKNPKYIEYLRRTIDWRMNNEIID